MSRKKNAINNESLKKIKIKLSQVNEYDKPNSNTVRSNSDKSRTN